MATLVAKYTFNEGSGTTTADSSGNNFNGTLVGSPNWVPGVTAYALSFINASYVSVADTSSLRIIGDVSLAFWVKLNSLNTYNLALWKSPNGITGEYGIRITATTGVITLFRGDGVTNESACSSSGTISIGALSHVAASVGGSIVSFYINGTLNSLGTLTVAAGTTANSVTIGGQIGNDTNNVDGLLDNVRIYNGTLSGSDVSTIYSSESPSIVGGGYSGAGLIFRGL